MISYLKKNLRYSTLHFLYLLFINPKYVRWLNKETNFHKTFLENSKLIFDIGANRGDKTHVFYKFSKQVIAYEPEIKMYKILIDRFINKNIVINSNVVSNKSGSSNFYSVENDEAYSSLIQKSLNHLNPKKKITKIKKTSTTLNKEIKKYGKPDYIKIDCEGAEYLILENLKYKIKLISIEANLPHFFEETSKIILLMEKKFKSKFNIRVHEKYQFVFNKNISSKRCINFIKKKKVVEIFIFS